VPSFEVVMADDRPVPLWDPSPSAPTMIQEIEFAPDSPLEGEGFEPSVPLEGVGLERRRSVFPIPA
jgi:hypothetical protein